MRTSDIVIGGLYSNGKEGRFYGERKVSAMGLAHEVYPGWERRWGLAGAEDNFILRYEVVRGYPPRWEDTVMTVRGFAQWAKERVK